LYPPSGGTAGVAPSDAFISASAKAFSALFRSCSILTKSCVPLAIAVLSLYFFSRVVVFSNASQKLGVPLLPLPLPLPLLPLLAGEQHASTARPASLLAIKSGVIIDDLGMVIMVSSFLISLAARI